MIGMVQLMCTSLVLCGSMCKSGKDALIGEYPYMYTCSKFQKFISMYQFRFDKDRSGNIDSGELQEALGAFGYRL